MAIEKLIVGNHKWPESINFDQDGNLYFTDAIEKALFQIKRNKDDTLTSASINEFADPHVIADLSDGTGNPFS